MTSDPKLQQLLAPLTEPEDDLAVRRVQVDREKIVSRMVAVAAAPAVRRSPSVTLGWAVALAASFALAAWGGLQLWRRASPAAGLEVVALRGRVTGVQGEQSSGFSVGKPVLLAAQGTLETSSGGEARIKTAAGLELELLENTRVALNELGAGGNSTALRLERGRVRCVIPHRPGRTFSVVTSAARVVDVGTTFSVGVEQTEAGPLTSVHVEEGEVLVQYTGGQTRLTAAQSWSSQSEASQQKPHPLPVAAPAPAAEAAREESASPVPRRDAVKRAPETLALETELLRRGLASEQAGDFRAAAAAFQKLVTRYPGSQLAPDAQSGLARVKGRLESPQ